MAQIRLSLKDEKATRQAGADIGMGLAPATLIFLQGDLGAGKTCLARAIIQQLAGDRELEVPSPTFALVQEYEGNTTSNIKHIAHCDLYRIGDVDEIEELDIQQIGERLIMVEWADKAEGLLGEADLTFNLIEKDEGRELIIDGASIHIERLKRSFLIREFLDHAWTSDIEREKFFGDASTRSYEFSKFGNQKRILMNAPNQPDGPIIKDGKPYSQIANLAESMDAFVGVQQILKEADFSVPEIYAEDLEEGLLLLENLGNQSIITEDRLPIEEYYLQSVAMLAEFHSKEVSYTAQLSNGSTYQVPNYSDDALQIEAELLLDWYAPRMKTETNQDPVSESEGLAFRTIWVKLCDILKTSEKHLVLRDFHSPNIIWLDQREGAKKIGLIDFQDAVIGPTAYDVASIAQDARIDISQDLENHMLDHYINLRLSNGDFNEEVFRRDYAIMAAQRATKILGIFVRLDERDNKPAYLKHLPRMQEYILRSLRHETLSEYRDWYLSVMKM